MRGLLTQTLLIVMLAMMIVGQSIREYNKDVDLIDFIDNNMTWNMNYTVEHLNESDNPKVKRVTNVVYKFVDFIGYSMFEMSKVALEFGYTHPGYDFNFMMYAIIFIMILPVFLPIVAVLYLIFTWVMGLKKRGNEDE